MQYNNSDAVKKYYVSRNENEVCKKVIGLANRISSEMIANGIPIHDISQYMIFICYEILGLY